MLYLAKLARISESIEIRKKNNAINSEDENNFINNDHEFLNIQQ